MSMDENHGFILWTFSCTRRLSDHPQFLDNALFSEQPDRLDLDVSHMFLNYSGCDIGVGMLFSRGRLRFSMVFSCRTHRKNARNQWDWWLHQARWGRRSGAIRVTSSWCRFVTFRIWMGWRMMKVYEGGWIISFIPESYLKHPETIRVLWKLIWNWTCDFPQLLLSASQIWMGSLVGGFDMSWYTTG